MWVTSKLGFYSIVQDFTRRGHFLVRARVREDLDNLLTAAELKLKPLHLVGSDYEWRVRVSGAQLSRVFFVLEGSIDYSNFKDAVGMAPGQGNRKELYSQVWAILKSSLSDLGWQARERR